MTDSYLIAHKVRGIAAFDVAIKMTCPHCNGGGSITPFDEPTFGGPCLECDTQGYWWIVSTSGHRARPFWDCKLSHFSVGAVQATIEDMCPEMPENHPDHYAFHDAYRQSEGKTKQDAEALLKELGI